MRTISKHLICTFSVGVLGLSAMSPAAMAIDEPADTASSEISVDRIALELNNPATALRSLAIDIEYRRYQGDLPDIDGRSSWRYVFTPSWPFKLKNGKNILLSATIPVNGDQPIWMVDVRTEYAEFLIRQLPDSAFEVGQLVSGHTHLDDIGFSLGYGGVNENGFISTFGLTSVFWTSTDRQASRDQFLLGPEFAVGKVTRWGLIAAEAKHLTNISGESDWNTNETTLKISFAYGLGKGWQIESNPIIAYDWEAVSGNEWSIPIGVGASKTLKIGSVPLKLALEIQNFLESADRFGPEWLFKFSITPVISTKLLR